MALFWNRENWQALCWRCHSRKTAKEDGRWGTR
jgi:5-methylcytosine-specific restriction protein A